MFHKNDSNLDSVIMYLSNVFCLEHVPKFVDIPKTSDTFWKNTNLDRLIHGSNMGFNTLFGGILSTNLKAYKDQGSSFILFHDKKKNDEYIHNLQKDGRLEEGIFRYRYANGDTEIGSKYFKFRSGREEFRKYILYKDNESGNIQYRDQSKKWLYHDEWKTLAKYSFNPETLDWKKLDV